MKYSCDVEIDLPLDRVSELFDNPDNLPKWQDGLLLFEHVEGEPGTPGAKSRLRYKMGKREIDMVETLVRREPPDRFDAIYEAKGVWNLNENIFTDIGGRTNWHVDTEFRCSGFIRIMAFFMPGMFKKQTLKVMNDFKAFAEAQGLTPK